MGHAAIFIGIKFRYVAYVHANPSGHACLAGSNLARG